MEKKFAFLQFHVFEDHKHTFSVDCREFFQNPVMLKTDRFLEKELRDKIDRGLKVISLRARLLVSVLFVFFVACLERR